MSVLLRRVRGDAERLAARRGIAETRVGKSQIERLRWLLSFCARSPADFRRLSSSTLSEIEADAEYFASRGYHPTLGRTVLFKGRRVLAELEHKLTSDDLAALAGQSDLAIRKFLGGEPFILESGGRRFWRALSPSFAESWGGDVQFLFLMSAMDVLKAEGKRITTCVSETCGKVFVRRKRGAYCSRACSQRERTRRHREKLGAEAWSRKRHDLYVEQVRKLKGSNVADKVRRRKERNR